MVDVNRNRKIHHIFLIHTYKENLPLNNLQRFICHKTFSNQFNELKNSIFFLDNCNISDMKFNQAV